MNHFLAFVEFQFDMQNTHIDVIQSKSSHHKKLLIRIQDSYNQFFFVKKNLISDIQQKNAQLQKLFQQIFQHFHIRNIINLVENAEEVFFKI